MADQPDATETAGGLPPLVRYLLYAAIGVVVLVFAIDLVEFAMQL